MEEKLRRIAVLMALAALPFTASGALAESPTMTAVDTTQIKRVVEFSLPPLTLPDIRGRVWKLSHAERSILPAQLRKSQQVLAFFGNPKYKWVIAPRQEKCWDVPWQRQCTIARSKLRLHHELAETAQWRLQHEFPQTNDWQTAVRVVQRVYPGTADWMLYISDREGGYGPWVWYGGRHWSGYHVGGDNVTGDDTVGGWMQFRYSTFAPYWRGAIKDLRSRGFVIPKFPDRGGPEEYQPWLDPLAQALTAGYMRYYGKDACHWCL